MIYNDLPVVSIIAVQGRLPGELALAYRHKNCADTLKVRRSENGSQFLHFKTSSSAQFRETNGL